MPSPFPGMDPYIEQRELWSDFHNDLAAEIRAALNQKVQPKYFARNTRYVTYDTIEVDTFRPEGLYTDVGVWESQPQAPGPMAVAVSPAPFESLIAYEIPFRQHNIEIHDSVTKALVTVIEILSPVNKRVGHKAHTDYLRKRRRLLNSETHLLEIDLLRAGTRPPLAKPVPPAPYYITLSRANRRPRIEVWPIQLYDALPVVPVPLLAPDPDVALDLGGAVASVYERGAYGAEIDYTPSPTPPLTEVEATWLNEWLQKVGVR